MTIVARILSVTCMEAMLLIILFHPQAGQGQTLDELYRKAMREGVVNFYGTLAQVNAEKILPVFEKRFAGIKINHVDITSDNLVARAVAEARGGKTVGDIFQAPLETALQTYHQKLLLEVSLPEYSAYPTNMKGSYWVASNLQYIVVAWNTNLLKKADEPKWIDDLADAKYQGSLVAEPRDYEFLMGIAKHKFKDDGKARALLRAIAANGVEFHKGHSQLTELLTGGLAKLCVTCYAHQFPGRMKKGAPVNFLLSEGIGSINATAIFKDAPHPNAALLFARWAASEEGQKVYAEGGRAPAHPKVKPIDPIQPERLYPLGVDDIEEYPKYEKIWKEVLKLR
ncbi:MAG: ABC transporter substrate-binding protein [Candidatus Binatia bacterium]